MASSWRGRPEERAGRPRRSSTGTRAGADHEFMADLVDLAAAGTMQLPGVLGLLTARYGRGDSRPDRGSSRPRHDLRCAPSAYSCGVLEGRPSGRPSVVLDDRPLRTLNLAPSSGTHHETYDAGEDEVEDGHAVSLLTAHAQAEHRARRRPLTIGMARAVVGRLPRGIAVTLRLAPDGDRIVVSRAGQPFVTLTACGSVAWTRVRPPAGAPPVATPAHIAGRERFRRAVARAARALTTLRRPTGTHRGGAERRPAGRRPASRRRGVSRDDGEDDGGAASSGPEAGR